ncbi:hypothetical protein CGLO_16948 [Colletotrichum gloeosporioides Cg-14]|uniref:Uncharacterized protein n=1 Tax=Colletotrichum gloeosporioides (strain Cg-14) TaxID=1237896 RepID=T0JXT4_COLGC|nr:hypothetical protein CGLO_16948 [Colletotrichum gloeosporioides Cg-14]
MDPWGNVKIPYLRPESSGDWRDIRQDLTTDDYSSLAGVPLSDLTYDVHSQNQMGLIVT